MLSHRHLSLCFFFWATVNASPLILRQADNSTTNGLNSTQSVQTTQTMQTVVGPMTQTCTITLTPSQDADGNPIVVEVQACTLDTNPGGNNTAGISEPSSPSTSDSTSSSTTSAANAATTAFSTSVVSTATASSNTPPTPSGSSPVSVNGFSAVTSVAPAATSTTSGTSGSSPASVNGFLTVSSAPPQATQATQSGVSSSTPAGAAASVKGFSTVPSSAISTSILNPTAAADNAGVQSQASSPAASATEAAAFTEPGRKLSVLPIGLAVFAGISVIALIVVGLVTYERTKYRKAFRQRKLAEAGTSYNGMAGRI